MRKNLVVGLLAEKKNEWEKRAALTPRDVRWLVGWGIRVEVVSSSIRVFRDREYQNAGAKVVTRLKAAKLILGIKEPSPESLIPGTIYMVFSHTTKGQIQNRGLLKGFLREKITLADYEHIVEPSGERLAYFGRYAGICGMTDTLHVLGQKWSSEGISNPFSSLKSAVHYGNYAKTKTSLGKIRSAIRKKGFHRKLSPFITGIMGHGNVSLGAQEVLDALGAIKIHPKDIRRHLKGKHLEANAIYKLVFQREEKLRSRGGEGFYFEEYLKDPKRFESNLDRYLPHLTVLINASYWDKRYPRLVPERMIKRIYKRKPFKLTVIGDLSCDIRGSIEITQKITTPDKPAYLYNPRSGKISSNLSGRGIAIMATDNLPCEFPKESSQEFSGQIRDYVYQVAAHGVIDLTHHHALPREIRDAVITQNGKLTKRFKHLQ